MATVRIETEVELDVAMMAKAFAHMNSYEQARFLGLAHRQMATYTKEKPDGTLDELGSYGREMQMLSIKDSFDDQPDAREFILSLYQMTIEEDEDAPAAKTYTLERSGIHDEVLVETGLTAEQVLERRGLDKARIVLESSLGPVSWDDANANPIEDFRKAKAMIEADVGFKPADHDVMTEVAKRYFAQQYMNDFGGKLPPAISPKEARAQVNMAPNTFVTCDPSKLNIVGSLAHTGNGGAYIGRVVKWHDDGMVTIEVAPGVKPYDPAHPMPIDIKQTFDRDANKAFLDAVYRNKTTLDDMLSPNADTAPNVAERRQCDECKGTGTWTNPFTDETTPCSRGCKP